jgi:hypothetical protein
MFQQKNQLAMKNAIRILLILIVPFACNEDDQNNPNQNTEEPFVTEIGIPDGAAVTKEIGPSGGSFSSGDGVLDIIIPAGAVSGNTIFGVQPITNFCPGGKFTYRLLPEGLTFTNPATLVFHYTDEDMEGTLPEFLGIAYQGKDKIWYSLPGSEVDAASRAVSVKVKHFTDWSAIEHLGIFPEVPAIPELRVNQTIGLSVYGQGMSTGEDDLPPLPAAPADNPSSDEDHLPPLPAPRPFQTRWLVNGIENGSDAVGTISLKDALTHTYSYKAPSQTPSDNIVLVSAEITGLRQWVIEGGSPRVTTRNMVVLFKRIKIKTDEYNFTLKLELKDGAPCAYAGHLSVDKVEMDIAVRGSQVTVTNIVNHQETINPAIITLTPPGGMTECSVTCDPAGGAGYFNVVSGAGQVDPIPFKDSRYVFKVILNTKGASTPASTVVCTGLPPAVANPTTFDHEDIYTFVLADSTQVQSSDSQYGFFATLTPR